MPNDKLINNIHWKLYPNFDTGYVIANEIMEPNDDINHNYIAVEIATEMKDGTNDTDMYNQLSGIAREVRRMYGPNCAIGIMAMDHGVLINTVQMCIYDDNTY